MRLFSYGFTSLIDLHMLHSLPLWTSSFRNEIICAPKSAAAASDETAEKAGSTLLVREHDEASASSETDLRVALATRVGSSRRKILQFES